MIEAAIAVLSGLVPHLGLDEGRDILPRHGVLLSFPVCLQTLDKEAVLLGRPYVIVQLLGRGLKLGVCCEQVLNGVPLMTHLLYPRKWTSKPVAVLFDADDCGSEETIVPPTSTVCHELRSNDECHCWHGDFAGHCVGCNSFSVVLLSHARGLNSATADDWSGAGYCVGCNNVIGRCRNTSTRCDCDNCIGRDHVVCV